MTHRWRGHNPRDKDTSEEACLLKKALHEQVVSRVVEHAWPRQSQKRKDLSTWMLEGELIHCNY